MNKKAFTLIELLAVIIIIGLIAVITVPKINDSIEQSRKKLAETSALSYTKTIDKYLLDQQIDKNKISLNGTYNINQNGNIYNTTNEYDLEYTGKKPTNGILTYQDNELQSACITINKYAVTIINNEVTNLQKGICEFTSIEDSIIAIAQEYATSLKESKGNVTGIYDVPIEDITNSNVSVGWVALANGEINSYSLKIDSYIVTLSNGETTIKKQETFLSVIIKRNEIPLTSDQTITVGDKVILKSENNKEEFIVIGVDTTNNTATLLANNVLNKSTGFQGILNDFTEDNYSSYLDHCAAFSKVQYWTSNEADLVTDIYEPTRDKEPENEYYSIAYYVKMYVSNLQSLGFTQVQSTGARLLKYSEVTSGGIAEPYIRAGNELGYWFSSVNSLLTHVGTVDYLGNVAYSHFEDDEGYGVRPVIIISTSNI